MGVAVNAQSNPAASVRYLMPGARSIRDVRNLSDLIREHDEAAKSTVVGTAFYVDELARRETARRERLMLRLTWAIFSLTAVNVGTVIVFAVTG